MNTKVIQARIDDIVLSALEEMKAKNSYFVQVIDIIERSKSCHLTVYKYFPNYYSILAGVACYVNHQFLDFLKSRPVEGKISRKTYTWFYCCLMEYLSLEPFLARFLGEDINSLIYSTVDTRIKALYQESRDNLVKYIYEQLKVSVESGGLKLSSYTTLDYISEHLYQNYQHHIAKLSNLSAEARDLELYRFKYSEFGLLDNLNWQPKNDEYDYDKLQYRMSEHLKRYR